MALTMKWRSIAMIAALLASAGGAHAGRLEDVQKRGTVRCGILASSAGQSELDDKGRWHGFSIDYCRGLAAAVFSDPAKVEFRPAPLPQLLTALKSGDLDVVAATLTRTMSREIELGYVFIGPTIYTGLTFMVPKEAKVSTIKGLNGATICLGTGSLAEEIVPQYMRTRKVTFTPLATSSTQQTYSMYDSKRCDAVTGDRMTLEARRLDRPDPSGHIILSETYGKSETGPVVRAGDVAWTNVTQYTHYAMVTAEELGVTQGNVDEMRTSTNTEVRRFIGLDGKLGSKLGLRDDFAAAVIKAVGNYSEVWDRSLGSQAPTKSPREVNKPVSEGGLLTAPLWR